MGLTAAAVVATLEFVFARKRQAVQWMINTVHHHNLLAGFGLHLLITTVLLMAAAIMVGPMHAKLLMAHLKTHVRTRRQAGCMQPLIYPELNCCAWQLKHDKAMHRKDHKSC